MNALSFILGLFSYFFITGAGVSLAFQQILNNHLRSELSSPWWAGVGSYLIGGSIMLLIAVVDTIIHPTSHHSLWLAIRQTHFVSWLGGIFGAVFVITGIIMIPRMGVAMVLAFVVVGQMGAAILFDHLGLFGLVRHPIDSCRIIGVFMLIMGVVLVRH